MRYYWEVCYGYRQRPKIHGGAAKEAREHAVKLLLNALNPSTTGISGADLQKRKDYIKQSLENKLSSQIVESARNSLPDDIKNKPEVKKAFDEVIKNYDEKFKSLKESTPKRGAMLSGLEHSAAHQKGPVPVKPLQKSPPKQTRANKPKSQAFQEACNALICSEIKYCYF